MDEKDEKFLWSCHMGLQVCLKLLCILFESTPLHDQGLVRGVVMLMEVGQDLELFLTSTRS